MPRKNLTSIMLVAKRLETKVLNEVVCGQNKLQKETQPKASVQHIGWVLKQTKKVSSKKYYVHRLMIRHNQEIYILRSRQLYRQYVVDMFAKIKSKRLRFIHFNQTKLRLEEYIHLRDSVIGNIDVNLIISDIGSAVT